MKRIALVVTAILLAFSGFAQKQPKFTEEDAKQFYRTMQGDYVMQVNDSTTAMVHFVPIWERPDNRFQWMYVEATIGKNVVFQKILELQPKKNVVFQKILELQPKTDKKFRVYLYDLKNPAEFARKWANRNYFDGFNTSILKGKKRMTFVKTSDFSYQTNDGPSRYGALDCFPKGDLLHVKFVQEDERFYIKRVPKGTSRIIGYRAADVIVLQSASVDVKLSIFVFPRQCLRASQQHNLHVVGRLIEVQHQLVFGIIQGDGVERVFALCVANAGLFAGIGGFQTHGGEHSSHLEVFHDLFLHFL